MNIMMPKQISAMILTGIIILLSSACITSSSFYDGLREACPYSNFCKTPSLRTFDTADDVTPCCYDCFCDDECWAHEDCCPDFDSNITMGLSTMLDCKPTYHRNNYTASLLGQGHISEASLQHFRVIDFCPQNISLDHVMHKYCAGISDTLPDYDDVVPVSDKKSRMFKNKYCAQCHGVSEFTRWKIVVDECRYSIVQLYVPLSELTQFILNHCVIHFERPADVPLNSRTLTCNLNSCSNKDSDFYKGCLEGPHMPYISWHVYKNALCYKCLSNKENLDDVCEVADKKDKTIGSAPFKLILDLTQRPTDTIPSSQSKCGEVEIYDPKKDSCTRLYCPPFEVANYGDCVKMSKDISNLNTEMNFVFPLANKNLTMEHSNINVYNRRLRDHYLKLVIQSYGFWNCSIIFFTAKVLYESDSHQLISIVVTIRFAIERSCSLEYISSCINKKQNENISINWVLGQRNVELSGQVSFFGMTPSLNVDNTFYIIVDTSGTKGIHYIQTFILCRYIILDIGDYKFWLMKTGSTALPQSLSKLSFTTWMEPGFYALSESKIAVCVDTYLSSTGISNIVQSPFSITVSMIHVIDILFAGIFSFSCFSKN